MKNPNVPQPFPSESVAACFQAAKAMAFTMALADPELIDWKDRATLHASGRMGQQTHLSFNGSFSARSIEGDHHARYQSRS